MTSVDLFDAQFATPTLNDLNPYNLVVTWSNFPYADQNAVGDVLADYQDSGQGFVIPLAFSFYDGVWGLFGRWRNEGYSPFTYTTAIEFGSFTLGAHDPSHPLMQGVTDLSTNFRINLALAPGRLRSRPGPTPFRWSHSRTTSSRSTPISGPRHSGAASSRV